MRKLGIALAGLALAASAAAAPSPASFRGIVVGSQKGTLLVTSSGGAVRAFPGHVRIGARVAVVGGNLTVIGRAHHALVKGVVVRRRGNLTFLSASNHMLILHRGVRTVSSARDSAPAPGTVVLANVRIDDHGELDEENENEVGRQQEIEVQGVITTVAAGSVTLAVNGQQLTIPLPAGLTLPATLVGTQVSLKVEFGEGAAAVAPGAVDNDDEDDDDDVTTTTVTTTTPMSTTTTPAFHHGDDDGDHHGGDGHHGSGRD